MLELDLSHASARVSVSADFCHVQARFYQTDLVANHVLHFPRQPPTNQRQPHPLAPPGERDRRIPVQPIARTMFPAWGLVAIFGTSSLPAGASDTLDIQAQQAAVKTDGGPIPGGWNLWSSGRVGQYIKVARSERYTIVVRAWGSPAGRVWPEMAFLVDELEVKSVTVASDQPADYAVSVELDAGDHEIAAAFRNDAQIGNEDRNLYLERITIDVPPGAPAPSI